MLHFAWVAQGEGRYEGQMAVYVKPRGLFATLHGADQARCLIIDLALMRQIERL